MGLVTEESQRMFVILRTKDFLTKFISNLENNSWAVETLLLGKKA